MRISKSIHKETRCHMSAYQWGICLAFETFHLGLFQTVVQYTADTANDKAIIVSPKMTQISMSNIKPLQTAPQYNYGERVTHCNHPNIIGVVVGIYWHFNTKRFFYKIKIGEKIKSKRYFENDFVPNNKNYL